jgi:HlyD family secretion protein
VQAGRYDEAVARRKEAEEVLQELLEGTRSEQIDQARSAVDAAQANIETLELSLDRTTIRAPTAGVVEALPYEPGERPPQGATVVAMLADGRTYGRVYIPQPERNRLGPGARAEIRIDGYPQPFAGELHWVAADPAFTPFFALTRFDRSRLSYLAEVDLLDPVAADLPAGLAVEVYFPDL